MNNKTGRGSGGKALQSVGQTKFRRDVPCQYWLQEQIDHVVERGKNKYGVPCMKSITGWFTGKVNVPVDLLVSIPGQRGEQSNIRENDLACLKKIMRDTGKLPLLDDGNEYTPYIEVAHDGSAWVNEGNHRIMAAKALGWKTLPVTIRYFDGGEMKAGKMSPVNLLNPDNENGIVQGFCDRIRSDIPESKVNLLLVLV